MTDPYGPCVNTVQGKSIIILPPTWYMKWLGVDDIDAALLFASWLPLRLLAVLLWLLLLDDEDPPALPVEFEVLFAFAPCGFVLVICRRRCLRIWKALFSKKKLITTFKANSNGYLYQIKSLHYVCR